ncbi:MAG TPA: hypothetical protein VNU94_06090 [Acidobacteriaceae bacterium]|nr:hypothetical protein [Acidobacteriaceae bacterium]
MRHYVIRIVIAMTVYAALLPATIVTLQLTHPQRAIVLALSILPSIPIIAVLVIVGLYLKEETDEFQRMLLQQSLLWGMGCTLAFISIWGFLEMFAHVRHLPLFYVFPIFWLFGGISRAIQRTKYRSGDE